MGSYLEVNFCSRQIHLCVGSTPRPRADALASGHRIYAACPRAYRHSMTLTSRHGVCETTADQLDASLIMRAVAALMHPPTRSMMTILGVLRNIHG